MDTVQLPQETEFPREEVLLGYTSAKPQKENEDIGNKKKVIILRQKGKTVKYQDKSRMNN